MPDPGDVAPAGASVPDVPLDEVEAAVQAALARGDDTGLRVLGHGEISLVIGWPAEQPTAACKRLPPFTGSARADTYGERFREYVEVLGSRGVTAVPSRFRVVTTDGGAVAYVVQPALPAGELGPAVLRRDVPDPEHPLLAGVVDAVAGVVDDATGLDAQISNWALTDGALRYLDLTTPLRFGPDGRLLLDTEVFLAAYPWAMRAAIGRFVAPGVVGAYRDARRVLVDLAANLVKERLEHWVPAAVAAANRVVDPAISADEVRRYYRSDARLWEVMLRLRRADRWWQRSVRRRTYPFLLPGPIER